MSDDYLWSKAGDPDPEVARLEKLLAPLAHDPAKVPLDELRLRRGTSRVWIGVAIAAVAAAAIVILIVRRDPGCAAGGEGMTFVGIGEVTCAGAGAAGHAVARGTLPVGGTLDTGANAAKLAIASIGTAELGANTRVRLDRTSASGHSLFLEQGTMHAKVNAPPRLFAITTPSTAVTDLGCEYAIEVDAKGAGSIRVISGKVELQAKGGTIVVAPAGTHATILPGNRPGIPLVTAASDELVAAVHDYERGVAGAIEHVLAVATESDLITLVNIAMLEPANLAVLQRIGASGKAGQELERVRDEIVSSQIVIDALMDR